MHAEYALVLDEPNEEDTNIPVQELEFLVDDDAIDLLGDYVKLDYRQSLGFRLSNKEEILSYRLQLKK